MTTTRLQSLLLEVRRRKVARVAVVYAATGFVVLQAAADILVPALHLPQWTATFVPSRQPQEFGAWSHLGYLAIQVGEYDTAIAAYRRREALVEQHPVVLALAADRYHRVDLDGALLPPRQPQDVYVNDDSRARQ